MDYLENLNFWKSSLEGGSLYFHEFYSQEPHQIFEVKTEEKVPHVSGMKT